MADVVLLIRHGEVANPDHVVYASLPGFPLSPAGLSQAEATGRHLASLPLRAVVSSPVERAAQTAEIVAAPHHLDVTSDERLTEWALSQRWAGRAWADLPRLFPGELETYLTDPLDMPFAPESLAAIAARVAAVATEAAADHADGAVAIVSHQDPIQAARLALTGRPLRELHGDKPGHASVVALRPGQTWAERWYWVPDPTM